VEITTTATTAAAKAAAGASVTFVVAETAANSIDADATITAGGKTLSGTATTAQSITVVVTADADGDAVLDLTYAGIEDADSFKVTVSAADTDGVATIVGGGAAVVTLNGSDSSATAIVDVLGLGGANGDNPVHATTVGGAISVSYAVVDQFGQAPVGTHRLKVATAAAGGAINSTLAVSSSGSANLSTSDNSDAAGNYNAVATVELWDAVAETWGAVGAVSKTSVINVAAALPAGTRVTVTENADSTATAATNVLSAAALGTIDGRTSRDSAALPAIPGANSILSGIVYGANGAPQAGATVTISAPGVMFVTDSAHYSLGSTTIKTGATGAWGDVAVLSTTAGKHTVTVTSGTGSATEDVYFGAAAHNSGAVVVVSAPATVLRGSTLQVSATVTDKFGNAVDTSTGAATVAVTYTGPGLIVGTLPTETDADGMVKFNVLFGSNDSGTFAATVTYRPAGAVVDTDNISASASVVVGTVGNVGALSGWTKNLNDGTVKMYAKNIVGVGKVQFFLNGEEIAWVRAATAADSKLREANGAYYLVRTVDLVEGQKNALEIYVDGVRIERNAYSY
jgi:hypothetical protein